MSAMFNDLMTGLKEVEAFLAGETSGYKVTLPATIDVKGIRSRLKMTQARFSHTFGFSLDAVKHWEGGRRIPEASARAFLTVIARNPGAVIEALHPPQHRRTRRYRGAPGHERANKHQAGATAPSKPAQRSNRSRVA